MSDILSKYLVPKTFAEHGLHEMLPICTYMLTQHTQCLHGHVPVNSAVQSNRIYWCSHITQVPDLCAQEELVRNSNTPHDNRS